MNTILRAAFDGPEPVRRALHSLGVTGKGFAKIIDCATRPRRERRAVEQRNGEVPALKHGMRAGAAVGSLAGAAIAVSAALYLSAAAAPFVLVAFAGTGLGALGGWVAGAILEGGYDLDQASGQDLWEGRVLVTVTAGSDQVAEAEAALVQSGGRLLPRF